MKKKGIVKIFAVVLAIVIISVSTVVFADVGNINRYDSGSSSSSSSSHSYSSGSSYHVSSSSGGGGGSIGGLIVAVIVIGIVVFVVGRSKGKINNIKDMTDINKVKDVLNDLGNDTSSSTVNTNTKGIAEEIRQSDPEFSEEKFLSWSKDVFVKLQAAWTARDWKIIRPFESNELFEQIYKLFAALNVTNSEADASLYDIRDLVIKADSLSVEKDLSGIKIARKNGVKTHAGTSNKSTTNCPNCGAPTEITSAGQCEYCGSVITTGEHDWVLTGLEGIK